MFHLKQIIASPLILSACLLGGCTETVSDEVGPKTAAFSLPDLPVLPTPKPALDESDQGRLYYATRSPYDFSVLLNDFL